MISRILFASERALLYIKNHPQLLFVLILIFIIPLLFLYNGQQFLKVGVENQNKLEHDRIGLLHDVFVSLIEVTGLADLSIVEQKIQEIAKENPDIVVFRIVRKQNSTFIPKIALDTSVVGVPDIQDLYRIAYTYPNESLISESTVKGIRYIKGVRKFTVGDADYFILTVTSQQMLDDQFSSRKQGAFIILFFLYIFILALAYWHIRLTDYRYLYIKVRKANEMKDLFTNMIAHELRAPLTAIRGYASMINEGDVTSEQKKYADRIKISAERLLNIVNDLLDVARIQSGKLSVVKQEFDVSEVVISVTDELHISAQEKNIILEHTGAIEAHLIIGDRSRLHQALINIVSNAIKYTRQGTIVISVEEKLRNIEIRVKDTGMGISSEDQKELFAPFFRVQNDDVSQITGTGLGMWITKQLLELMGAKIGVESIKGVGTHIVIKIKKETTDEDTH